MLPNKLIVGLFDQELFQVLDRFSTEKKFQKIKEGDYISLANVGAYGMSLSSNYNTRPFIAEIMVSGSKHKVIRKRQSLKNLVNN